MSSGTPVRSGPRGGAVIRAVAAAVALLVVAWWLVTRAGLLAAGHPAAPILLAVVALVSVLVLLRQVRHPRRHRRVVGTVFVALGALLASLLLAGLRPYVAEPQATTLTAGTDQVRVVSTPTRYELVPTTGAPTAGLVFHPGALVDTRAYLPLLVQIASRGYVVEVVKPPLGFALLSAGGVDQARARHPGVTSWSVGGHSLGGVQASMAADGSGVDGLLLWASYPASPLPSELTVTSVYGTEDQVLPQADIEASRADLPSDVELVPVPGAVHAFFGDYGPQRGDGIAEVDRAVAQQQIVAASVALLDRAGR